MDSQLLNDNLPRLSPPLFILAFLVVAVVVLLRPYWGLLLAITISITLSIPTLTFSRLPGLGAYTNFGDAMLLVALAATFLDARKRHVTLSLPWLPILSLFILTEGALNTSFDQGIQYETIRALRWATSIPLYFFIGYNTILNEQRSKLLIHTLFAGALSAEIQHLYYVITGLTVMSAANLRSTMFIHAHSETWLVATPLLMMQFKRKAWWLIASTFVFISAMVSHQTRSILVATLGALVIVLGLFDHRMPLKRKLFVSVAFVGVAALVLLLVISNPGFESLLDAFSERFAGLTPGDVDLSEASLSRQLAMETEISDYLSGNILIGNGLYYFQKYINGTSGTFDAHEVAFGHLGYLTYLSQLGLIGFVYYALLFPITTVYHSFRLWNRPQAAPWTSSVGLLTAALFIFSMIGFLFSNHFLTNDILPGLLAGAVAQLHLSSQHRFSTSVQALRLKRLAHS